MKATNSIIAHYTIKDGDDGKILAQKTIIAPKIKGYIHLIEGLPEAIREFFEGGRK